MSLAAEKSLLVRVLEPEVMESPEEARDYDAMDHAGVNRGFVEDFLVAARGANLASDADVLDLGTGTAQIPIELCAQNPTVHVMAIDMAET
jgi:ubiquinone/menaquinone biosynthesis C-methylase UbiE